MIEYDTSPTTIVEIKNTSGAENEQISAIKDMFNDIAAVGAIIATDNATVSIILKLSFFKPDFPILIPPKKIKRPTILKL